jgi:hypothetical protein
MTEQNNETGRELVPGSRAISIVDDGVDPYERLGDALDRGTSLIGAALKFTKGQWLTGKDKLLVPAGTEVIVGMDLQRVGWVKWLDRKIIDEAMAYVGRNELPPRRGALGDLDQSKWETDNRSGAPKDPWTFIVNLPMAIRADGTLMTFSTNSAGGRSEVGHLSKLFGRHRKAHPDVFPLIRLAVDGYDHKQFGYIATPKFEPAGYVPKEEFYEAMEAAQAPEPRSAQPSRLEVPNSDEGRRAEQRAEQRRKEEAEQQRRAEMDDDIPF